MSYLQRKNWKQIPLGDLCDIKRGNTITKLQVSDGDIPVIASAIGPSYYHNQSNRAGEIITVSASGVNAGYVDFYAEPIFASDCITIQPLPKNNLNLRFVFYSLKAKQNAITSFQRGTAQAHVYPKDLIPFKTFYPSIEEQTQIAELFQSIETAIEQAEQQENNLLKLKNQLLRELTGEKMQFVNFLKEEDFEKIKFEKIAFNISERVEPKATDLKTYVGLEHLDADNLKIERTGTPDDVIGTKLKIYKGDIIFGKRRAYLRKVAVSHFYGIASAHSMILRANEKQIEKCFLPHFLQSDVFMRRAVQISEGSLSPTIKWKTLASQEFILPKKYKQKQLSEVFEQFEKTRDELKSQKQTLITLKQKLLNEILA